MGIQRDCIQKGVTNPKLSQRSSAKQSLENLISFCAHNKLISH